MGEMVNFPANGETARGYLAVPAAGHGPGVVVLQEWWGLHPQITRVADRLAAEGFVALVPDLYHGELAEHTEMDKAARLMQSLPMERASRDMAGAVRHLQDRPEVDGDRVGVIGFCMGGMLTLRLAAEMGDAVGAAVPFYGAPLGDAAPDWSGLRAPVRGHFAEQDDFFPPEGVRALEAELRAAGKDVTFVVHPGTGHAFANEDNPLGTYDAQAAATAWEDAVAFLRTHLVAG